MYYMSTRAMPAELIMHSFLLACRCVLYSFSVHQNLAYVQWMDVFCLHLHCVPPFDALTIDRSLTDDRLMLCAAASGWPTE